MNKIRALIVDDEPLAREGIAVMLESDPEIEIVGMCSDGQAALEEIKSKKPDLAFLDIHMPRLDGIKALEKIPSENRPAIIFITAHDKYAVQAFESNAVDYLLKPFRDDRFRAAVTRAKDQIRRVNLGRMHEHAKALYEFFEKVNAPAAEAVETPAGVPDGDRLVFKIAGDFVFLNPEDVVWVEAQGNSIKIGAAGQVHLVRESLQSVEDRLDPVRFARVHRSFVVNVKHIRRIVPVLYGDYDVLMSDGVKVRLSRSYREKLKELLPPGLT
jgi:two-component system LytT family response regulator